MKTRDTSLMGIEVIFCGTDAEDGEKLEVDGCDVVTFRNGMIAVKNTHMKT